MFLSCEASCNLAHRDERWTVNLRGLEFSLAAWSFQGAKRAASDSGTNSQYLRHLADDVLPGIIEGALSVARS